MAHQVIMPQMGESIAEGTITTWLKKVGDRVERDEPLFEISTDKVDAEIPSPAAGILNEIKVEPGQTVAINTVVAVIGEEGEKPAEAAPKKEAKAAAPAPAKAEASGSEEKRSANEGKAPTEAKPQPAAEAAPSDDADPLDDRRKTKSSPVVRKIAAEHNIDISQLPGTGISGRVTKSDILEHIETSKSGASPARPAAPSAQASGSAYSTQVPDSFRPQVLEGDRVEDMSPMRQKIAEHMVWSKRISSHVSAVFEVDFSHVDKLRVKNKAAWQQKYDVNLTYTSFIMKAAVDALKVFPIMNASLDNNRIIHHRDINLGLAVALDWGLIVPVIHKADELNVLGLTRRAGDLAQRARIKKLKPNEVQSGTFTITNPGIFGSLFGLPVINQPQVAIMGVGKVEKRPVVIDDMIAIRTRAYMSISFDHRLIDGAIADQFMSRVKQGIEEFDESNLT